MDQIQGVPDGAAQSVQGVHHDHVPLAGLVQGFMESWAVCGEPGFFVHVDMFGEATFATECVDLPFEVLFHS